MGAVVGWANDAEDWARRRSGLQPGSADLCMHQLVLARNHGNVATSIAKSSLRLLGAEVIPALQDLEPAALDEETVISERPVFTTTGV